MKKYILFILINCLSLGKTDNKLLNYYNDIAKNPHKEKDIIKKYLDKMTAEYPQITNAFKPENYTTRLFDKNTMYTKCGNLYSIFDKKYHRFSSEINDNFKKNIALDPAKGFLKFHEDTNKIIYNYCEHPLTLTLINPAEIKDEWIACDGYIQWLYGKRSKSRYIKSFLNDLYESTFTCKEKLDFKKFGLSASLIFTKKITNNPKNPFEFNSYVIVEMNVFKDFYNEKIWDYTEMFLFKVDELLPAPVEDMKKYQEHIKKHNRIHNFLIDEKNQRSSNVMPLGILMSALCITTTFIIVRKIPDIYQQDKEKKLTDINIKDKNNQDKHNEKSEIKAISVSSSKPSIKSHI